MLRFVSMSGDKGRGALPAAQACHMRRRRTLACQGRPCSPSGTNSWRPSTVGCGPFEKTRAPPGLQFTGPLMRRRIHACHMRRRRTLACHWTFNETHLIAAGLQGAKCSQVYLRMRRAFHDWMTNANVMWERLNTSELRRVEAELVSSTLLASFSA